MGHCTLCCQIELYSVVSLTTAIIYYSHNNIMEEYYSNYVFYNSLLFFKIGVVFGSDSKPLEHNHIQRFLAKSEKLRGKPKMIFFQACQGESLGAKAMEDKLPDIATDDDRISEYTDFYLSCASVAGDRSYRDIFTGTHSTFHSGTWGGGGFIINIVSQSSLYILLEIS